MAVLDKVAGTVQVFFSNGSGFVSPKGNGEQPWIANFAAGSRWQVLAGDFSGDGIDDLAAYDSADGKWKFARSTGKKFLLENWFMTYGKDPEGRVLAGDFNGDKKFDLAVERHFAKGQTPVDIAFSVINKRK